MSGNRNGGSSRSASSSPTDRNRLLPVPAATSAALSRPTSPSLPPSIPPLHITVRFSIDLPDLELDIPRPHETTVVALKHLIRSRLAEGSKASSVSKSRLRFIHAGKILPDKSPLSLVLRAPPPPPSGHHSTSRLSSSKGKNVEGRNPASTSRVYVNCSIGDELSAAELTEEARAAAQPVVSDPDALSSAGSTPRSSPSPFGYGSTTTTAATTSGRQGGLRLDTSGSNLRNNGGNGGNGATSGNNSPPVQQDGGAPVPRGFDRYLAGGLPREDVLALRRTFRANVAMRHTPDTMPSPDTLLRMEDAWIDTNAPGAAGGGGGGGDSWDSGVDVNEGMPEDDDGSLAQVSDQLIVGMMIGFFFPMGAIGWVLREPGMLAKRWLTFILLGVALSILMGSVRVLMGGDGGDGG
ncbi:DUF2407 C-terminal domain containing protein [Naviculisporaceae sp. PSN 640]